MKSEKNMSNLEYALTSLNKEQLDAVTHFNAPLLILAGAGAGKTKVITTKIAYLIEKGIEPYKILAVTFTNKAAEEMKTRAIKLNEASAESTIRTFHSFGAWFLRRFYSDNTMLSRGFSIYDDSDCITLLSSCFPSTNKLTLKQLYKRISRAKDDFLLPEDISADSEYFDIKDSYQKYQIKLRETGNVDFGDLILLPTLCLKQNPDIKKYIQNYFSVILVDEFQDSNIAQMELLKELTADKTYLCVVGDDDQSIYKFRGASVSNILSFQDIFNNADIIKLEKNYRSTPQILHVANSIIKNNEGRLGKELKPTQPDNIKPILFIEENQTMEAERIISLISTDIKENKTHFSDWAILYRTNSQSRNLETSFLNAGIPYKVIGSLRFYEREEIKDSIAFLKLILNLKDEVSFVRIINKPPRGIGEVSKQKLTSILMETASSTTPTVVPLELHFNEDKNSDTDIDDKLETVLKKISKISVSKKIKTETEIFFKQIFFLRKILEKKESIETSITLQYSSGLSFFVALALEVSELVNYHHTQDEILNTQKLSNLQELVNMAINYEFSEDGLVSFLEMLSLDTNISVTQNNLNDAVTLITIHGTKGLEFNQVIITGLEENVFPITRNSTTEDIEEERRLMYVACTRARDRLFMISVRMRMWEGRASTMDLSRFIYEIEKDLFIVKDNSTANAFSKKEYHTNENFFPKMYSLEKGYTQHHSKWKKDTVVYSDEYGYGRITKCEYCNEDITFEVMFESKERKIYFPPYNTASLEIVSTDE